MEEEDQYKNFAKKLADSRKTVREKNIKKFTGWVQKKPQGFTLNDSLKLWRGLYFSMWMADKLGPQQALAGELAQLIHVFANDAGIIWMKAFFATIEREWQNIDGLRLDKYYFLIRLFLKESFRWLQIRSWGSQWVTKFVEMISVPLRIVGDHPETKTIKQLGLQYHLSSIYLEYLNEVSRENKPAVPSQVLLQLVSPFFNILKEANESVFRERVKDEVFCSLLETVETQNEKGKIQSKPKWSSLSPNFRAFSDKLFAIASSRDDFPNKNRELLYDLKKQFDTKH